MMMVDSSDPVCIATDSWEGCTPRELAEHLRVPAVHVFARVGSTNDVARDLADAGAASGTVVLAEEQWKGRGRATRSWISPAGLGLWLTVILRDQDPTRMGLLPIRVALAVASALDPWTGARLRVKWPNDLVLRDRKLGGILCEASWEGHRLDHAVVGIGLNLLQSPDDFPEPLRSSATSLRATTGTPISRFDVATRVIGSLRPLIDGSAADPDLLAEEFAARDALAGRNVEVRDVDSGRELISGVVGGIDRDGALLVDTSTGSIAVRSGTVRIRGTGS